MLRRRFFFKNFFYPSTALAAWYKKNISKTFFYRINTNKNLLGINSLTLNQKIKKKELKLNFTVFFWKNNWISWLPKQKDNNIIFNLSRSYIKNFFYFLRGLGTWCLTKLKFKGKSFRWYRKKSSLILRFGHSHLVSWNPAPFNIKWRRKGRMKILFFGSNKFDLSFYLSYIIRWRPMNIYHGRGLRFSKQIVIRKSGKVSAYR